MVPVLTIMELLVRRCDINDLEILRDVSITTFRKAFASENTVEDMNDYLQKSFNLKQVEKELLHPHSEFYLAYYKEKLVGYLKVNFGPAQTDINDDTSLELERIYILEEFQGRGFGPQLLEKTIDIAKENKLKYVWLGVWEKNSRAIRVYRKRGFLKFKSHTFWLGRDKQTDELMKLELEIQN